MTEITEDDIHYVSDSGWCYLGISIENEGDTNEQIDKNFNELKQQILQALEKSKLYDVFCKYAEKTQRIHEERRGSSSAPFNMSVGINALIPMDLKEFTDYKQALELQKRIEEEIKNKKCDCKCHTDAKLESPKHCVWCSQMHNIGLFLQQLLEPKSEKA